MQSNPFRTMLEQLTELEINVYERPTTSRVQPLRFADRLELRTSRGEMLTKAG